VLKQLACPRRLTTIAVEQVAHFLFLGLFGLFGLLWSRLDFFFVLVHLW